MTLENQAIRRPKNTASTMTQAAGELPHQSRPTPKSNGKAADVIEDRRPTVAAKANADAAGDTSHRSNLLPKANAVAADVNEARRSTPSPKAIMDSAGETPHRSKGPLKSIAATAEVAEDGRFVEASILTIRELWRRRQAWHRAEKSLTLAATAICRGHVGVKGKGDKAGLKRAAALLERIEAGTATEADQAATLSVTPLLMARAQLRPHREAVEKDLEKRAKLLPVASVVKETPGFGLLSLAGIVCEAGDLSAYRSCRGLWKRLGVAVINGERQRCKTDPAEALAHGYSPARRSVLWNVGNALIGALGHGPRPLVGEDIAARDDWSPWQKMFVERLRFEVERDPETHTREPVNGKESFSAHAANRARRYVEKQFVEMLRQKWRDEVRARSSPSVESRSAPAGANGEQRSICTANADQRPAAVPPSIQELRSNEQAKATQDQAGANGGGPSEARKANQPSAAPQNSPRSTTLTKATQTAAGATGKRRSVVDTQARNPAAAVPPSIPRSTSRATSNRLSAGATGRRSTRAAKAVIDSAAVPSIHEPRSMQLTKAKHRPAGAKGSGGPIIDRKAKEATAAVPHPLE